MHLFVKILAIFALFLHYFQYASESSNDRFEETIQSADKPSSGSGKKIKKKGCEWLLVSHDEVTPIQFLEAWRKCCETVKGDVSFKVEPAILHVQCRNLSSAKKLVHAATESGFRNSGMVIGRENRITVAVRSALGLEVPLRAISEESLISDEFLEYLLAQANDKITENWIRLDKFTEEFRKTFTE